MRTRTALLGIATAMSLLVAAPAAYATGGTITEDGTTLVVTAQDGVAADQYAMAITAWQPDASTISFSDFSWDPSQMWPTDVAGAPHCLKEDVGAGRSMRFRVTCTGVTWTQIKIVGGPARDSFNGAPVTGHPEIVGVQVPVVADGGAGNDEFTGGTKDDTLVGGSGVDQLDGGPGNDLLDTGLPTGRQTTAEHADGGDGNDTLISRQFSHQGFVQDRLGGGAGNDVLDARGARKGADPSFSGDLGNDKFYGGPANSMVGGGAGNDVFIGGTGNEALWGQAGVDTVRGGAGDDDLRAENVDGGAGDDRIQGSFGNDKLVGGPGADTIDPQDGRDVIDGGAGPDRILAGNGRKDVSRITCTKTRMLAQRDIIIANSNDVIVNRASCRKITIKAFAKSTTD